MIESLLDYMYQVIIGSSCLAPICQTFATEEECRTWAKKRFCLMLRDGHHVNIGGSIVNTETKEVISLKEPNFVEFVDT